MEQTLVEILKRTPMLVMQPNYKFTAESRHSNSFWGFFDLDTKQYFHEPDMPREDAKEQFLKHYHGTSELFDVFNIGHRYALGDYEDFGVMYQHWLGGGYFFTSLDIHKTPKDYEELVYYGTLKGKLKEDSYLMQTAPMLELSKDPKFKPRKLREIKFSYNYIGYSEKNPNTERITGRREATANAPFAVYRYLMFEHTDNNEDYNYVLKCVVDEPAIVREMFGGVKIFCDEFMVKPEERVNETPVLITPPTLGIITRISGWFS